VAQTHTVKRVFRFFGSEAQLVLSWEKVGYTLEGHDPLGASLRDFCEVHELDWLL
jgi:hypothetical protein